MQTVGIIQITMQKDGGNLQLVWKSMQGSLTQQLRQQFNLDAPATHHQLSAPAALSCYPNGTSLNNFIFLCEAVGK